MTCNVSMGTLSLTRSLPVSPHCPHQSWPHVVATKMLSPVQRTIIPHTDDISQRSITQNRSERPPPGPSATVGRVYVRTGSSGGQYRLSATDRQLPTDRETKTKSRPTSRPGRTKPRREIWRETHSSTPRPRRQTQSILRERSAYYYVDNF